MAGSQEHGGEQAESTEGHEDDAQAGIACVDPNATEEESAWDQYD